MKHKLIILFLTFLPVCTSQVCGQQDVTQEYDKLNISLQKDFDSKFGFSVLIGNNGKVLFNKAYGFADKQKTQPADNKTLFNIASITKSFTAAGIMLLAEQNKITLDDSIGHFFDNVPSDKHSIKISQLLSHLSGYKQNYVCDGLKNSSQALNALLIDKLGFNPGTGFGYSNQNFEMLALIIEEITHLKYEEFIRSEILKPLGMNDTYFWDEITNNTNVAAKNREFPDSLTGRNWGYIGSGGIYSTPSDLYKFIYALIHYQIITEKSAKKLFRTYVKSSSGSGIGYGWFIDNSTPWSTREIWSRGTEDWGHNAVIRWFPDKNTIIIVCTDSGEIGNRETTGNRIISDYIANFFWK